MSAAEPVLRRRDIARRRRAARRNRRIALGAGVLSAVGLTWGVYAAPQVSLPFEAAVLSAPSDRADDSVSRDARPSTLAGVAAREAEESSGGPLDDVPQARRLPVVSQGKLVRCTAPGTVEGRRAAEVLRRRLDAAVAAAGKDVALAIHDPSTDVACSARAGRRYESASIVKVTIVAALLRQVRAQQRSLSSSERTWARASITRSDNDATSALWNRIGGAAGLRKVLAAANMTHTVPGSGPFWGLSKVTAADELALLERVTSGRLLVPKDRTYLLGLMAAVTPSQRWGVPAGAPASATVGNKNGWLPRSTDGWRVHSIGWVRTSTGTYCLALLSDHNRTWDAGIDRLERLARTIHTGVAEVTS